MRCLSKWKQILPHPEHDYMAGWIWRNTTFGELLFPWASYSIIKSSFFCLIHCRYHHRKKPITLSSMIQLYNSSTVRLGWPLWNICVTNDHGYVPLEVNTSPYFPHSWLITGFVTRLTRRVSFVEQELLTLSEHLSSPPGFSGVPVTRSAVLYVCFVDRCLSFCTFSFGHYVVCSSSIYGFWLPLWYFIFRTEQ
jgi:hypothetical protein